MANIAQRHRRAGMGPLPDAQVDRHQRDPDPGADHDQHDADVVERAADQRRVEGVEHRGAAERDRHHRHDGADHDQPEPGPGPAHADQRLLERDLADGVAEAHRDQRREARSPSPCRARSASGSTSSGLLIQVCSGLRTNICQAPRSSASAEDGEGEPEMGEDQPPTSQHSSASRFLRASSSNSALSITLTLRPHALVADAAELLAGHQVLAGLRRSARRCSET